jgi:hypothetical protein
MDKVFNTASGNNGVMFMREARDEGDGSVRETANYDRRFLKSQV